LEAEVKSARERERALEAEVKSARERERALEGKIASLEVDKAALRADLRHFKFGMFEPVCQCGNLNLDEFDFLLFI
jgi:predicted  nucleic acid-binding Zn-ribbon protein